MKKSLVMGLWSLVLLTGSAQGVVWTNAPPPVVPPGYTNNTMPPPPWYQVIQFGGVVGGVYSNEHFSAVGSNQILAIASSLSGAGATQGVFVAVSSPTNFISTVSTQEGARLYFTYCATNGAAGGAAISNVDAFVSTSAGLISQGTNALNKAQLTNTIALAAAAAKQGDLNSLGVTVTNNASNFANYLPLAGATPMQGNLDMGYFRIMHASTIVATDSVGAASFQQPDASFALNANGSASFASGAASISSAGVFSGNGSGLTSLNITFPTSTGSVLSINGTNGNIIITPAWINAVSNSATNVVLSGSFGGIFAGNGGGLTNLALPSGVTTQGFITAASIHAVPDSTRLLDESWMTNKVVFTNSGMALSPFYTFNVPADVTNLLIKVFGAAGCAGYGSGGTLALAGRGGSALQPYVATPSQTLYICIGQGGHYGNAATNYSTYAVSYPGGGLNSAAGMASGSGGGYTCVLVNTNGFPWTTSAFISNFVTCAAGGGGSGSTVNSCEGGSGGGAVGKFGQGTVFASGGSQSAGGTGTGGNGSAFMGASSGNSIYGAGGGGRFGGGAGSAGAGGSSYVSSPLGKMIEGNNSGDIDWMTGVGEIRGNYNYANQAQGGPGLCVIRYRSGF